MKVLFLILYMIYLSGCSTTHNKISSICDEDRTILDGVCVKKEIADYVSCVRAQGATLVSDTSSELSADAGYFGVKASAASEVSDRLERQYVTSDQAMINIINNCNRLSGISPKIPVKKSPIYPNEEKENRGLSGHYTYGNGVGRAKVEQEGENIHMYLTYTPEGKGPHFEVKGTLKGNVIEGEWYSIFADRGWYYFYSEVSETGRSIDFAGSDDPIGVSFNRVRLMKR